jgi:acyl carrier protein
VSEPLEQDIRVLVAEILEIEPSLLNNEKQFQDTVKLVDSVAMLEILVTLEKKYPITIQEEEVKKIGSWHDLIELVRKKINKS